MEFVKDFLIYEAGALCGFFIAALMNAARAGQEITIKFEEDPAGFSGFQSTYSWRSPPDSSHRHRHTSFFLLRLLRVSEESV